MPIPVPSAHAAGTLRLAGRAVHRIGFGTLQLSGPGHWGPPRDPAAAVALLRRAVDLGIDFVDTADSYGPHVCEELVAAALHPYPDHVVIATKAGLVRPGPDAWVPLGRPEYLRQQAELSLRRLRTERLGLFQLHRIDPAVPLADQVGVLRELLHEGKIAAAGLSQVGVAQLREALTIAPIASVQNRYNVRHRRRADLLRFAEVHGIAVVPWFPVDAGALADRDGPLAGVARELGATPAQVALAWLLARSPVLLPIPGTSSIAHLEENTAAGALRLEPHHVDALDALAGTG